MRTAACFAALSLLWAITVAGSSDLMYHRRKGHGLAVFKDRLYIDGGLIAIYADEPIQGENKTREVSSITSISLATNWNNTNVQMQTLEYPASVNSMMFPGFWVDEASNRLHRWGGEYADGSNASYMDNNMMLWSFDVGNNTGSGTWSRQSANSFAPAIFGASTTCAGSHLYFGGQSTPQSYYQASQALTPLEGVLEYNLTTQEWKRYKDGNGTLPGNYGTFHAGQAICLEGFTSNPLVLLFGGRYRDPFTLKEASNPNQDVVLYDPINHQWYNQTTIGAPSGGRNNFCAVGAKGKNGTYEIYAFGGEDGYTKSDVCILTLPAFNWVCPIAASEKERLYHSCVVGGERQMISVGGFTGYYDPQANQSDTWANTIGVLDLPSLSWKESYEADAGEYDSPQIIKNLYSKGYQKPSWAHPAVEALFTTTSGGNKTGNQTTPETASKSGSGANVRAIVGGVIGGVAALALILAALWWLRRRRQSAAQQAASQNEPGDTAPPVYSGTDHKTYELGPHMDPSQLDAGADGMRELEGMSRSELDGSTPVATYRNSREN